MNAQPTPTSHARRHHHGLFALLGLGSLAWLIARTGSKPQRLSYPCQQAALAQTLGALWYLAPLLGAAHILRRLRQRAGRLQAFALVGAALLLALLTAGDPNVTPAQAASGPLESWTSASAISDIFVVANVPEPECSLTTGALPTTAPCNSAAYALRDRGVDRLVAQMDDQGTYFYKTTAHASGLIGASDVVVIKINNQWAAYGDGTGRGRLTTSTDVVKGVIWRILQHPDGFTGEVVIAENTQGVQSDWDLTPANSQDQTQSWQDIVDTFVGLGYAVSLQGWDDLNGTLISGGSVSDPIPAGEYGDPVVRDPDQRQTDGYILLDDSAASGGADQLSYPKFRTAGGRYVSMRYGIWNTTTSTYESSRLKFINMPVLKRHGMAGSTICWKNLVGFQTIADNTRRFGVDNRVDDWDEMHYFFWGWVRDSEHVPSYAADYGLLGREMAQIRKPDLNIVDAIWIGTQDNTSGPANRQDVIAASTDPFAADWYTSEYVLRNAVGNDGMDGNTAARGGNFRTATRVNQNAARAAWPGGTAAYPWIDLLDGYDGDTVSATERQQMNVYLASMSTPSLAISDVTVTEGASGPVAADFVVTLSPASGETVTVNYTTVDGTATAGSDYEAQNGTLTFAAGVTSQTISVDVLGDALDEPDAETFRVTLSTPPYAIIEDAQGLGTITDDDPAPSLALGDISVSEGQTGTTAAVLTLSLSEPSGQRVTAGWTTANGSATAPADYTASSGSVTFAPLQTSRTLSVPVRGDLLDEPNETFVVNLTTAITNATVGDGQGEVTILDDEGLPGLAIADVAVVEGNTGVRNAVVTARLTPASGRQVSVAWQTADGAAVAGADYTAASGVLTFPAGVTTRTLAVPVLGDTFDEANEAFAVVLSAPIDATLADDTAAVTITDDDATPSLRIDDRALPEGDWGNNVDLTVRLSAASARQVTVNWTTAPATATTTEDFRAASGTLTFAPGVTTQTVTVVCDGDSLVEPNETFKLLLGGAVNATLAKATGIVTLTNDDWLLQMTNTAWSVRETPAAVTFTVTRTGALGQAITADYTTSDRTATAGLDYVATTGTLSFAAGVASRTFTVPILGDSLGEAHETFAVALSNACCSGTLGPKAAGIVTILDDDAHVSLSSSKYRVTEGASAAITVTRLGSTAAGLTVGYRTVSLANGAAAEDYTPASGTLTFRAGQISATFVVPTTSDTLDEGDEDVRIELTGADLGGASFPLVAPTVATLTIVDNDTSGTFQLAAASYSVREGGTVTASIVRTGGLASDVVVSYTASLISANWDDMSGAAGSLTFAAGQVRQDITITAIADDISEGNESFWLELNVAGAPNGPELGARARVPVTILDDEPFVELTAANYTVTEGATASPVFRRVNSTAAGVTVDYQIVPVTASGADYTAATPGTLTFAAGQLTKPLPILTTQDTLPEATETLRVEITGSSIAVSWPARVATLAIRDNDRYAATDIVFVTEGASFAPVIVLRAPATVLWTFDDGTTSDSLTPSKDYGTETRRANRLRVTPWSALRRINIGYDAGDGGSAEIEFVADQRVSAVHNLSLVAPYLEFWCSSYNLIEELSFDNFVALDTLECFLSSSLRKLSLRNVPRLRRVCFEDNSLLAYDLTGVPALADLRGAANDYPTINFLARHEKTWHVCVRDNPQITNRTLFANTGRFPRINELFIWNTHQAGALVVPSSASSTSIAAAGNAYTSADFRGALRDAGGWGVIDLSNNRLTSVMLAGCVQLRQLNLSNNPLSAAAVDSILEELDLLGTSGGTADLSNTAPPTAIGLAYVTNLQARGWTITLTP